MHGRILCCRHLPLTSHSGNFVSKEVLVARLSSFFLSASLPTSAALRIHVTPKPIVYLLILRDFASFIEKYYQRRLDSKPLAFWTVSLMSHSNIHPTPIRFPIIDNSLWSIHAAWKQKGLLPKVVSFIA